MTNDAVKTTMDAPTSTNKAALAMVTALFFMWGFITVLNDILIPHLRSIFELNYAEVMLVQFSFFSAYFVFSFPSGKLVERFGYKRAMVVGLCTMGAGALGFIAAASVPSFALFLCALIVVAAGMTVLQVAANPYVAVLGPASTASSRLNLAQAFNSLGTTLGPFLGSLVILGRAPQVVQDLHALSSAQLQQYRLQEAASVKLPYFGIGLTLLALALALGFSHLPNIAGEESKVAAGRAPRSIWKHSRLLLAAIAIFTYVGGEVAIGSFLVNYLSQPDIANLAQKTAAGYVSFYWGGAMIGRFIGSALLQRIKTATLLAVFASVACALVVTSMATSGHVAAWSILAVGLFNSIMFPSIFTMGIEGMGALTGKASGLLIAAIIGGAIVPEIQGIFADHIGIHAAFFVPAICYVYIIFFAVRCSRDVVAPGIALPAEFVPPA